MPTRGSTSPNSSVTFSKEIEPGSPEVGAVQQVRLPEGSDAPLVGVVLDPALEPLPVGSGPLESVKPVLVQETMTRAARRIGSRRFIRLR
jgi:hypothetical protein